MNALLSAVYLYTKHRLLKYVTHSIKRAKTAGDAQSGSLCFNTAPSTIIIFFVNTESFQSKGPKIWFGTLKGLLKGLKFGYSSLVPTLIRNRFCLSIVNISLVFAVLGFRGGAIFYLGLQGEELSSVLVWAIFCLGLQGEELSSVLGFRRSHLLSGASGGRAVFCLGGREEEPQTAYPMSITWTLHITDTVLMRW